MFEHASKTSQTNKNFSFGFSEHSTRNKLFLRVGLDKRSGHPEQWSKIPQKYNLIRIFWPFFGPFGGIWRNLDSNLDFLLALTSIGMTDFLY